MRHSFLLDENMIYHAVRGVDRHNNQDDTAARLIQTIVTVCHYFVIHDIVRVRYIKIFEKLKRERAPHLPPAFLLKQILMRADKRIFQYDDLPTLPAECNVPRKDEYLVQAALLSLPLLVTADEPLYRSIKDNPGLGIEVLWPHEALERAKERPE